jgi:acyl transferase domain-containing protein/NADPH:quinone reductase-like Zn-dependent oxidoreductase/NAD(P)-dependent dehydrogenase (short-subunit alcohol dehydrogenase family)/acyl carrier protein
MTQAASPPAAPLLHTDAGPLAAEQERPGDGGQRSSRVALIGLSCRFPGAPNREAFWEVLANGRCTVEGPAAERARDFVSGAVSGGFLPEPAHFDANYFAISPREASSMDPQQRWLLEVVCEALHDAGLVLDEALRARTGVFVGLSTHDYEALGARLGFDAGADLYPITGSTPSVAAGRISYALGLHGPTLTIDTACSSSLVAVHMATRCLARGECDIAIVAAANGIFVSNVNRAFAQSGMLAPDARCKTFDAAADGYVRSEGCAAVVLRRAADAEQAGDSVRAFLRGSYVNHDGRSNGLTAPSRSAQREVISGALRDAGVSPSQVDYLEAHGTGTPLGDAIEVAAINDVFACEPRPSACVLGSVKTNLGHLEAVAGLASLIKVVLALQARKLPPHLHFARLNPRLDLASVPLRIASALEDWPSAGVPRLAGVSSFGLSGTNAHVIVEEAPAPPAAEREQPRFAGASPILALSAASERSLRAQAEAFSGFVSALDAPELATACVQSVTRQTPHARRVAVLSAEPAECAEALSAYLQGAEHPALYVAGGSARRTPRIGFVFPGQGGQWPGMGRDLLAREAVFREALERCDQVVLVHAGFSVIAALTAPEPGEAFERACFVQPLTFAIQVALCELLKSWGIRPDLVIGHSMGEVAAAYVAGALSLDDAARVVCVRSQIVGRVEGRGRMAVIDLPASEVERWTAASAGAVVIAAENGPRTTLIAGDTAAVVSIVQQLEAQAVFCRLVDVQYASHSPHMLELAAPLRELLGSLAPLTPAIEMISTVSGAALGEQLLGADYWVQNLCERVCFSAAVREAMAGGCDLLVEIGPHPVLKPSLQQLVLTGEEPCEVLSTLQRNTEDGMAVSRLLAELNVRGAHIDWTAVYAGALQAGLRWLENWPSYSWDRAAFWWPSAQAAAPGRALEPLPLGVTSLQPCALPAGALRCDLTLGVEATPRFADHVVEGAVLWSAADQLATMLETGAKALGKPVSLGAVRFAEALGLPAQDHARVQLLLERDEDGAQAERLLSCFSLEDALDQEARLVSQARVEPASPVLDEVDPGETIASITARCARRIDAEALYSSLAQQGLSYGPSYRTVREVYAGDSEALGRVQATADAALGPLLDGCFHVASALLSGRVGAERPFVPVALARVSWHGGDLTGPVYSHVTLQHVGEDDAAVSLRVLDAQGRERGSFEGLQLRALRPARPAEHAEDAWLHGLRWLDKPALERAPGDFAATLVVVGPPDGLAETLVQQLAAGGARTRYLRWQHAGDLSWSSELEHCLAAAVPTTALVLVGGAERQEGENGSGVQQLLGSQRGLCLAVQRALQAVVQAKSRHKPKLCWVSQGVHALGSQAPSACPQQAVAWGLLRSLRFEHPELSFACVDLSERPTPRELEQLAVELVGNDGEQEIALRDGARLVARLSSGADAVALRKRLEPARGRPYRLVQAQSGQLEGLALRESERRSLAQHEVEVVVEAAGMNFRDVLLALGALGTEDRALGREFAGRVSRLGSSVTQLRVGQPVLGIADDSFGSFAVADSRLVVPRPSGLDAVPAATLPIAHTTVYYALAKVARLARGERLLVHSASGGVGLAALQWARHVGAEVIATAGSAEKRRYLRELGVTHVFDSRSPDFAEQVREATGGEGVDVVLNSLSGPFIAKSLELLRDHGRFIELGKRDYEANRRIGLRPFLRNLSFSLIDLRAMCLQQPERVGALLCDVIEHVERGTLSALPAQTFEIGRAQDAFFHMSRAKHVGKVVLTMEREPELEVAVDAALFSADASYLITGGLGGLGLCLARYLVEHGARRLVLLGRSAPSGPALAALRELEELGAAAEVVAADVSDSAQLAPIFARFARDLPPLKGVFHAAGVLADGLLLGTSAANVDAVLAPKVLGAWNLAQLCETAPLDHFVLFSSAAGLLGSPGQAIYAGANTFLDALAGSLRSRGRPALSVDWGTFASVGLAASSELRGERLSQRGMTSLDPERAFALLGRLLRSAAPAHLGVLDLDARQLLEFYPSIAAAPIFSELLARAAAPTQAGAAASLPEELRALPLAHRREHLQGLLWKQLCSVLRLPGGEPQPDTGFKDLGLDSLMALELRNRIERVVGTSISAATLWRYPSARKLADGLLEMLGLGAELDNTCVDAEVSDSSAFAASAAELSDEQALRLIEHTLGLQEGAE